MGKKAINKNGTIKVYEGVPKVLYASNGTHLNAQAMSDAALRAAGLFDVVLPEGYNSAIHDLGDIFFDSANTVFTYTKSDNDQKGKTIIIEGTKKKELTTSPSISHNFITGVDAKDNIIWITTSKGVSRGELLK